MMVLKRSENERRYKATVTDFCFRNSPFPPTLHRNSTNLFNEFSQFFEDGLSLKSLPSRAHPFLLSFHFVKSTYVEIFVYFDIRADWKISEVAQRKREVDPFFFFFSLSSFRKNLTLKEG